MNELRFPLQPKQRQFLEAIDNYTITGYGGAKGGGKSHALRNILLYRRFKYPGSIGRIFRRTFPELQDNHITPLFGQFPDLRTYYDKQNKTLSLPNGSVLYFNHCQHEDDVFLYQGRETHDLAIDQAEQWTHGMYSILRGSNRSSVSGIVPKTILTFNPGDIGHAWLKRLFIERKFNPKEVGITHHFIQALIQDNPALMENDPEYVKALEAEPNEALRRAYLFGDWDIFAGQFFGEIRKEIHLIKPFEIPPHWNRFGAYDYGFGHCASFGWYAVGEDGNVYKYREYVKSGQRVDQFARYLNQFDDTAQLYPIVAGWDCWNKRSHTINEDEGPVPPTIAEEFAKHGINLKRANIDRIQGAAQLRSYLAWEGMPGNKPRLFIFNTCPITYETIARMIHDPDHMEDVLKVDSEGGDPSTGDDAYDETRYALMSRPSITDAPKPVIAMGSPAWHKKMNENLFDQALEHFKKQQEEQSGWPELVPFDRF